MPVINVALHKVDAWMKKALIGELTAVAAPAQRDRSTLNRTAGSGLLSLYVPTKTRYESQGFRQRNPDERAL
jgi:hypothetical protein